MDQATQNTLYLLSCAVNDTKLDNAKVGDMDLEAVFNVASRHMVSAIVAVALKSAGLTNRRFSQAFAQAQRKAVILNNDLAQIIASFEENGIWYMPLKGAVLKNLYPRFGMREMADIDMLIDVDKPSMPPSSSPDQMYEEDDYEAPDRGSSVEDQVLRSS